MTSKRLFYGDLSIILLKTKREETVFGPLSFSFKLSSLLQRPHGRGLIPFRIAQLHKSEGGSICIIP